MKSTGNCAYFIERGVLQAKLLAVQKVYSHANICSRVVSPSLIHADASLLMVAMIDGTILPWYLKTVAFLSFHTSHMTRLDFVMPCAVWSLR